MANPIPNVPLRTPMFDGDMKALGNLSRLWSEFFSNESGWISQGTHAERLATNPGSIPDGAFFIEKDRGAIYQSRFVGAAQAWVLVAGFMTGLLGARPRDLGTNDVGFFYSATDALDYRWNGVAWATLDTARGGGALVDVGRLTKVGAAGVLSESSVNDDGAHVTSSEPVAVTGAIRAMSATHVNPAAGKSVEIDYDSANDWGTIVAYDRDGAAHKPLRLNGDGVTQLHNGTEITLVDATGLDLTGAGAVYQVAGDQVVGPRLAAVTSPTGGGTVVAAPSGGGVIDVQARAAIVSIIAAISGAGNTVDPAARTAIDAIRDRLAIATGHGLTA